MPSSLVGHLEGWDGVWAVVKGAETLDGEWKAVEGATAEENAAMRFFKVVVEVQ